MRGRGRSRCLCRHSSRCSLNTSETQLQLCRKATFPRVVQPCKGHSPFCNHLSRTMLVFPYNRYSAQIPGHKSRLHRLSESAGLGFLSHASRRRHPCHPRSIVSPRIAPRYEVAVGHTLTDSAQPPTGPPSRLLCTQGTWAFADVLPSQQQKDGESPGLPVDGRTIRSGKPSS